MKESLTELSLEQQELIAANNNLLEGFNKLISKSLDAVCKKNKNLVKNNFIIAIRKDLSEGYKAGDLRKKIQLKTMEMPQGGFLYQVGLRGKDYNNLSELNNVLKKILNQSKYSMDNMTNADFRALSIIHINSQNELALLRNSSTNNPEEAEIKDRKIASLEADNRSLVSEMHKIKDSLNEKILEVQELNDSIKRQNEEIYKQSNTINGFKIEQIKQEEKVNQQSKTISEQDTKINSLKIEVASYAGETLQLRHRNEAQKEQLNQQSQELNVQRSELIKQGKLIGEQKAEIHLLNEKNSKLHNEITTQQKEVNSLKLENKELKNKISNQDEKINKQEKKITELNQTVNDQNENMQALKTIINNQNGTIATLNEDSSHKGKQIDNLELQMAQIKLLIQTSLISNNPQDISNTHSVNSSTNYSSGFFSDSSKSSASNASNEQSLPKSLGSWLGFAAEK